MAVSTIEIFAVSYNGARASASMKGVFASDGGTIGRGADNRLPLPDPARHVSRIQAKVRFDGARFWIANVADANPLFVNDQEVASGKERTITAGDELRLGLYVLKVREASGPPLVYSPAAAAPARAMPSPAPPPAPAMIPIQAPSLAQGGSIDSLLGSTGASGNPFADLLGAGPPRAPIPAPQAPAPTRAMSPPAPPPPAPPRPAEGSMDPLVALSGSGDGDPFADLLGAGTLGSRASSSTRSSPVERAFAGGGIPDDFDPFSAPSAQRRNSDDPLRDLAVSDVSLGGVDAGRSDALLDFTLAGKPDPNDSLHGGTPSLVDPLHAIDPMQLFGGSDDRLIANTAEAPNAMAMRDNRPELESHFTPPRSLPDPTLPSNRSSPVREPAADEMPAPRQPPAASDRARADVLPDAGDLLSSPTQPTPIAGPQMVSEPLVALSTGNAAASSARPEAAHRSAPVAGATPPDQTRPRSTLSSDELVKAFLDGARAAALRMPDGITPELMRSMGELVYEAVTGAMGLIAARGITKREIGAEMTMIVSSGNNPLKFLPTPEAAMMQILGPRMPGFMAAGQAMRNAFEDLSVHEVGVIAGTRGAFAEMLRRFDPAKLEELLGARSALHSIVPPLRAAMLWAIYEDHFNQIHREAEDDFDSLFGEAFTKAYEAEVAKLRGAK